MTTGDALTRAPRGRRIGARVVDIAVVGWALAFVAIEIDGRILGGDIFAQKPLDAVTPGGTRLAVITTLTLAVLEWIPTAIWGRTPGKAMLGVRCVEVRSGGRPGFLRSLLRSLLLHAWVWIPVFGWALPLAIAITTVVAPNGRAIHDRLAGTFVVDVVADDDGSGADDPGVTGRDDLLPGDPRLDPL